MNGFRRLSDVTLIVVFALALGVPAARFVLGRPKQPNVLAGENRPPAPKPAFSTQRKALNRFPSRFEAYFQDRLPGRELMLQEQARIQVDWLDTSSSDKVIVGRDGWLFLDEEKSENPGREISPQEQCRRWAQEFRNRRDWLAHRGIEYLIVLTPEKHSVYPEFLPELYRHSRGPTAAELLAQTLRAQQGMNVLVLREVLLAALTPHPSPQAWGEGNKSPPLPQLRERGPGVKGKPLYFHTDTHWNDEGAYVGYCALVNQLAARWPDLRPLEREQFEFDRSGRFTGDLCRMLHLPGERFEAFEAWRLRQPTARRVAEELPFDARLYVGNRLLPQIWGRQDPNLPRAVLFHDSFAERIWLPALAEHFDRLAYAPTDGFDAQIVEALRPQIVIQQIVERKINRHLPEPLRR